MCIRDRALILLVSNYCDEKTFLSETCERDEALAALKPQIAQVIKPYKLEQNDLQEPHFFPYLRQIYQVCDNKMIEDCTYQELLNAGVRIAVRKSPNTYVLEPEFHVFCKQHLEGEIIPTKKRKVECLPIGYSDFQNRIGFETACQNQKKKNFGF